MLFVTKKKKMKRDNHITIRLSDTELEQIERKANEKGVTRSEYIRLCLEEYELDEILSEIDEI